MKIIYSLLMFLVSCMVCMGEESQGKGGDAGEVHECASIVTEKKVKAFKDGTTVEVQVRKYYDAEQNIYKIEIQQENNIDQKCVLEYVYLFGIRPLSSDPCSGYEFGIMDVLCIPCLTGEHVPQKMEYDIYSTYKERKKESNPPYDISLVILYEKINEDMKEGIEISFDL